MNSFRAKLALYSLAAVFLCVAGAGYFSAAYFNSSYVADLKGYLLEKCILVEEALDGAPDEEIQPRLTEIAERLGGAEKIRITVVKADGSVLADSEHSPAEMENHINRPEIREAQSKGTGAARRRSDTVGREFLYVARKAKLRGAAVFIRVAAPAVEIDAVTGHTRLTIFIATAAAIVFSIVVTVFLTYKLTAPVARLIDTSEKLARGDMDARSGLRGADEFGRLGSALDAMADEIRNAMERLRFTKAETDAILQGLVDGLAAVRGDRNILFINDAALEIFGAEKKDWADKPFINVVRHRLINENLIGALENSESREFEVELHPISRTTYNVRIFPFSSRAGTADGAIIIVRDMTRLRKLETIRTEFVENASHEMRTPVAMIRGFTETLLGGAGDDEADRMKFLLLLDKESMRLERLMEGILALASAEKSGAEPEPAGVDAAAALAECAGAFGNAAAEKGLEIKTDFASAGRARVSPEDFRRIFSNLIDNAVKFTDSGAVTVSARKTESTLAITVSDTGIGIRPEETERVFERFYRTDKSRSRESGGAGLGLSIVKHLVEKWGGSISVAGNPGQGAEFRVELPA